MYSVNLSPRIKKEMRSLPRKMQLRFGEVIDLLQNDPRPHGCIAIKGQANQYRIRVGDYRLIYEVRDAQLVIVAIRVGHRRSVYHSN